MYKYKYNANVERSSTLAQQKVLIITTRCVESNGNWLLVTTCEPQVDKAAGIARLRIRPKQNQTQVAKRAKSKKIQN